MDSRGSGFLFVVKHSLIWIVVVLLLTNTPLVWGWTISKDHSTILPQTYGALTNALLFYLTALYLIPRFFNKSKRRKFWLYSIALIFTVTSIETFIDNYVGKAYGNEVYSVKIKNSSSNIQDYDLEIKKEEITLVNFVIEGFTYAFVINVFYFIIAFVYRVPIDRRTNFEREQHLIQEKLSAELQFLRAQVHPHTLFNGMNSIYHLIDSKPELAKETLLYLSNSLRYHLYDSQEPYVSLDKEIAYIREYIKLYQIRSETETRCRINIEEFEGDYKIAPLLFTPFIENAFKYVSRYPDSDNNFVDIELKIDGNKLFFISSNTIEEFTTPKTSKGIGLKNVKKRLYLIYGDLYKLKTEKKKDYFKVYLEIKLTT